MAEEETAEPGTLRAVNHGLAERLEVSEDGFPVSVGGIREAGETLPALTAVLEEATLPDLATFRVIELKSRRKEG